MTETIDPTVARKDVATHTSRWLQMARRGAVVIAAWSVVLQLVAGELIPPVAFFGVLFAALATVLAGERRKIGLLAVGIALVLVAGNLPMTIDELSHPSTAPAFLLTLLAVSAALVVMLSGVAAFRGWPTDPIKAVYYAWAGVAALGVVVAAGAASGVDTAEPVAGDRQVVAKGLEFNPDQIVVPAGESGFWLDNQDAVRHTFTIAGLGLEIEVPGLSAQRATFELDPGRYQVVCSVPGHDNMLIDLVVEG